jgi:cationic peptide transport system substrate-binding protein
MIVQALDANNKKWLLVILCLALSSCDVNQKFSLSSQSVIYCSEGSPEGFNPQTVTSGVTIDATSKQLYNQLINFETSDTNISPSLAKSWHVTRDGKKITFYLRKKVSFHQTAYFTPTRDFNADDVLFSFNRIIDKDHPFHNISGAEYPFFQSVGFSDLIKSIEKINDYTVRFILTRADNSLLVNLATDFSIILSEEYGQQLIRQGSLSSIDSQPIGTGPFKLKEYRAGSLIRYVPHPTYWNEASTLEQLIFDITPSNTGRLTKLLAGECDVAAYPIARNKIKDRSDLSIDNVTALNVGFLAFNTQMPPFDNKKVRKAVAHAIDKKAILKTVYYGDSEAEAASTIIPNTSWAYDESIETPDYSVEKAKVLLEQAGYADGFSMELWAMPVQRAYNPDAVTMAKLIQADLAKVNIKVNIIKNYEWTTFLKLVSQGLHQSVLLGWSADHPDPDNFFTPLLSCASAKTGNNRAFWCNNDFDNVIFEALQTSNIIKRKKYYSQALKIINEDLPLLPIAHAKRFQARSNKVEGVLLNAYGGINFHRVVKQ